MSTPTLPVGGVDDVCALCGQPVATAQEVGAVGLNGLACTFCTENLTHYTPRNSYLRLEDGDLALFEYRSQPGGPFHGTTVGCVFLECGYDSITAPEELTAVYEDLDDDSQALLWRTVADVPPESFAPIVRFDRAETPLEEAITWTEILTAHDTYGEPDDDAVYPMLRRRLPRPFLITGRGIFADASPELRDSLQSLVATKLSPDHREQQQLGAGTDRGSDTATGAASASESPSESESESTAHSDAASASVQAGLGSFED